MRCSCSTGREPRWPSIPPEGTPAQRSSSAATTLTTTATRQQASHLIDNAYRGNGWVTDQAFQAWHDADDVYFDRVTRIDVPRWATGRVVLVGDAASSVSLFGEGSSNAILGAKTLADAINATPTTPPSHSRRISAPTSGSPVEPVRRAADRAAAGAQDTAWDRAAQHRPAGFRSTPLNHTPTASQPVSAI